MRFELLAQTSDLVRRRGARLAKIEALRELLSELPPALVRPSVSLLAGALPQGRIGVGHASIREAAPGEASREPSLEVREVLDTLDEIKATSGAGSKQRKLELLGDLLRRATATEASFLVRVLIGELRQGALEGVMLDALARHTDIALEKVRRAAMVAGDLPAVAAALLERGEAGLEEFQVTVFRPLQPMLAQPAASPAEAMQGLAEAAIDLKIDGVRVQIHRQRDVVRVYSRRLNDVTASVPEIVERARSFGSSSFILDGETFLEAPGGAPLPFQATMSRFGRKVDVGTARAEAPLQLRVFDLLYEGGEDFTEKPLRERLQALERLVGTEVLVPGRSVRSVEEAEAFLEEALDAGHEGAMVKDLGSEYRAGTRSGGWQKLKTSHTLDLVVLAAEWGSGRRQGLLSNLHLGARAADGSFVMLGKTFKGLTDKLLAWQTERLLALRVDPSTPAEPAPGHWMVPVRPELVVEIAFNNVQASQQYPGGMALRFARVKRYREDKAADEADTIETVRALFDAERGTAAKRA